MLQPQAVHSYKVRKDTRIKHNKLGCLGKANPLRLPVSVSDSLNISERARCVACLLGRTSLGLHGGARDAAQRGNNTPLMLFSLSGA